MPPLHSWDVSPAQARELQIELAKRLVLSGEPEARLIAGFDCSCTKNNPGIWAVIVLFDLLDRRVVEIARAYKKAAFPYVSGLLAFREGPAYLEAFDALRHKPDVLLFDGQGFAHPRRMGLASHLGLWLKIPSFGCAKTRLWGKGEEPGWQAGSRSPLVDGDETIGAIVRTKSKVKSVYVSVGHLMSIEGACRLLQKSLLQVPLEGKIPGQGPGMEGPPRGYRIPEPIRLAHLEVNRFRTRNGEK